MALTAPFTITRNGRTWHGNVGLKEHHLVERGGSYAVFLVREVTAAPVPAPLAAALGRLIPGAATLLPDGLLLALRKHGLVAGEAAASAGATPCAAESGAPEPAADQWTPPPVTDRLTPLPVLAVSGVTLMLAQTCNLRCVYCYGGSGEYGEPGLMSARTARSAVDWLLAASLGAESVRIGFFGGEPLLNLPALRATVAYAKNQGAKRGTDVRFDLTTNATEVDDAAAAFLAKEGFAVVVSCDGPAALHDRQRPFRDGGGSYRQTMAGVRRLRAAGLRPVARAVVRGEGDPFAARRGLEAAGFERSGVGSASPAAREERAGAASRARRGAADRMLAYRREEVATLLSAVSARGSDPPPPTLLGPLAALVDGRRRHAHCGSGRRSRAVSASGDIYPCHRFVGVPGARLGHVADAPPGTANDYHRATVDRLPVCRACWARYLCGGGCFYDNEALTGDVRRPDQLSCREMQTVCEDLVHGWCRLGAAEKDRLRAAVHAELDHYQGRTTRRDDRRKHDE